MSKWLVIGIVSVVLLGGGGTWLLAHQTAPASEFRTSPVEREDLTPTITATGTLEPEEVVDVGAQVDGQIIAFGAEPGQAGKTVDYGSNVDVGSVLAKIDDRLYRFDLENARAEVDSAKATISKAQADLGQMNAKLYQATADWKRIEHLGPDSGVSESERDQYQANRLVAEANVADQKATIDQTKTTLAQDQAALEKAEQNVAYCTITSPVKGTIIDRRMNVGQTVVSAMSAPSLFLIAKDLRRMQVWAAVNEADVGSIHAGQAVEFTVDARPGETFRGTVGKVRYNASMTQNVVTYTVEINTDNDDRKLLPYLTANVKFMLDPRRAAQTVPNAALRWMPRDDQIAPGTAAADDDAAAAQPAAQAGGDALRDRGTAWVVAGPGRVRPVRVRVGVSDGSVTEIAPVNPSGLPDGSAVVTGEIDPGEVVADGASNPFVPQFGKKKK